MSKKRKKKPYSRKRRVMRTYYTLFFVSVAAVGGCSGLLMRKPPYPKLAVPEIDIRAFIMLLPGDVKAKLMQTGMILVGMVIVLLYLKHLKKKWKRKRYLRSPLKKIDKMGGVEFERYMRAYFETQGYKVSFTPLSGDYGADLILKKGHERTVVQVKRYTGNVGIDAIQQVIGAKGYYNADNMMVVTNRYFTPAAKNLARANSVKLMDRAELFSA